MMNNKIIFITPFLGEIGGVEKTARELSDSCHKNNITFSLYTLFTTGKDNSTELGKRKKCFTLFRFLFGTTFAVFIWSYLYFKNNTKFLSSIEGGNVIVRHSAMAYALLLMKKNCTTNFSITFLPAHYSKDFYYPIIKNNIVDKKIGRLLKSIINLLSERVFEKKILSKKNLNIVTFSYNLKRRLKESYKGSIDVEINVIRPGVSDNIVNAPKKFIVPDSKVKYLYVGRIDNGKNIDVLLNLFEKYNASNYQLKIVGSGALLDKLKSAYKHNPHFVFAGTLSGSHLALEYSKADYFILPTYNESYGHVIAEALSVGTPVIGFNFDGCNNAIEELVQPNVNGLHIQGSSQLNFNRTINNSISKRSFFHNSVNDISHNAKLKFSWDLFLSELIKLNKVREGNH